MAINHLSEWHLTHTSKKQVKHFLSLKLSPFEFNIQAFICFSTVSRFRENASLFHAYFAGLFKNYCLLKNLSSRPLYIAYGTFDTNRENLFAKMQYSKWWASMAYPAEVKFWTYCYLMESDWCVRKEHFTSTNQQSEIRASKVHIKIKFSPLKSSL